MLQATFLSSLVRQYDKLKLPGRDSLLAYLLILSGGGTWGPGLYDDFELQFAWGSWKDGQRYLFDLFSVLQSKSLVNLTQRPEGFAVEALPVSSKFSYLSELARPELIPWAEAVTAEGLSVYLLAGSIVHSAGGSFTFNADSLDGRFGMWGGRSCSGYLRRLLTALQMSRLLSFREMGREFEVTAVNDLPMSTQGAVQPAYYHPTHGRSQLPTQLRGRLWKEDGCICCYCLRSLSDGEAETDHIIPLYMNGAELDPGNLATACASCNSRRKWFKGVNAAKTSDAWRELLPRSWRGLPVMSVDEATVEEGGRTKRVPVVRCGTKP